MVQGELLAIERGANRTVEANGRHVQVRADQFIVRIDDVLSGAAGSPVRFEVVTLTTKIVGQFRQ